MQGYEPSATVGMWQVEGAHEREYATAPGLSRGEWRTGKYAWSC